MRHGAVAAYAGLVWVTTSSSSHGPRAARGCDQFLLSEWAIRHFYRYTAQSTFKGNVSRRKAVGPSNAEEESFWIGCHSEASGLSKRSNCFSPVASSAFASRSPLRLGRTQAAERRSMAHADGWCRMEFVHPLDIWIASRSRLQPRGHCNRSNDSAEECPTVARSA